MATTDHRRALLLALAVTMLWSSSWVLIRWGLDDHDLEPIGFAGLRYCLAALVLAAFVLARPRLRRALVDLDRAATGQLFSLGIVRSPSSPGSSSGSSRASGSGSQSGW